MCRMRHPVADQEIYIVGEAYSYEQGWVEGALNTAESMLEQFFGLSKPAWLLQDPAFAKILQDNPDYNFLPTTCPAPELNNTGNSCSCTDCSTVLNNVTTFAYEGINNVER